MDIETLAFRYKIAKTKLRAMLRDGYLPGVSDGRNLADRIIHYMRSNRPISVEMIIGLKRDPALFKALGKFEKPARALIKSFGDIEGEAYPAGRAVPYILAAATNEREALDDIAAWLAGIIPARGCGYHYVACRLAWNVPEDKFARVYAKLPRAILNIRSLPAMADIAVKIDGKAWFVPPRESFDL